MGWGQVHPIRHTTSAIGCVVVYYALAFSAGIKCWRCIFVVMRVVVAVLLTVPLEYRTLSSVPIPYPTVSYLDVLISITVYCVLRVLLFCLTTGGLEVLWAGARFAESATWHRAATWLWLLITRLSPSIATRLMRNQPHSASDNPRYAATLFIYLPTIFILKSADTPNNQEIGIVFFLPFKANLFLQ